MDEILLSGNSMFTEQALNLLHQGLPGKSCLLHDPVNASAQEPALRVGEVLCRHHYDGNVPPSRVCLDPLDHLKAIHLGHEQVKEDNVLRRNLQSAQGLLSAVGALDLIPFI